jgi:predicted nucleic acid-binding protein
MKSVLLDTCIVIDYLRQKKQATDYIQNLPTVPHLSAVTVMELYAGVRGRKEERHLEIMIGHSVVLDVSSEIGAEAGTILKVHKSKNGMDAIDAIIAATAKTHNLELATLNLKHFSMFKGLKRPY